MNTGEYPWWQSACLAHLRLGMGQKWKRGCGLQDLVSCFHVPGRANHFGVTNSIYDTPTPFIRLDGSQQAVKKTTSINRPTGDISFKGSPGFIPSFPSSRSKSKSSASDPEVFVQRRRGGPGPQQPRDLLRDLRVHVRTPGIRSSDLRGKVVSSWPVSDPFGLPIGETKPNLVFALTW